MSNFENIRPYSEMAHKVCLAGGPDIFTQNIYNLGFAAGVKHATPSLSSQALTIGKAILVYELAKFGIRSLKKLATKNADDTKRENPPEKNTPLIVSPDNSAANTNNYD